MIFDYSIFHTSMPNTSDKPREALITGYGERASERAFPITIPNAYTE